MRTFALFGAINTGFF